MAFFYRVLQNVFEEAFASRLLDYAIANEQRFQPSEVGSGDAGTVDRATRISAVLRNLGPLKADIRERLSTRASFFVSELGLSSFDVARIEVEMAAHNDGAFFGRHIDTIVDDQHELRMMSAVYYFHRQPRRYSGGALRLHALGRKAGEPDFQDVAPDHNSLVIFPSWVPHEVQPIVCPSRDFADSRFAINAWFLRKPAIAPSR